MGRIPYIEARIAGRLVRTFNDVQLAERYRERMAAIGAIVELARVRKPVRVAA